MRNIAVQRAILTLYDALSVLVCAALLSCAFVPQAHAYVDPSVMTYTIQAIAGVAVALSAIAGVALRRSRKAIMRALNIDENARKEVEGPVHRIDADGQPITSASGSMGSNATEAQSDDAETADYVVGGSFQPPVQNMPNLKPARLSWPSRLWRAAIASVFVVGTLFLVAPAEMVAANSESLVFSLADVWEPLWTTAAIIAVVMTLVLSLFQGKVFDCLLMVVVAIGVCLYVQALFMNQTLPAANGTVLDLSQHMANTVVSTIVWVLVIIGIVVLFAKRRFFGRNFVVFIALALIIVQSAAVVSLWVDPDNIELTPTETTDVSVTTHGPSVISMEGLFEVSPKNNVIILVLDTFDVLDMNELVDSDPDVLDQLTGFTYFRDSVGSLTPTRYGIPYLLTGSLPRTDQTWEEYTNSRYTSSSFISDISDQDYSLYIYTDTSGGGVEYLSTYASNIHPVDGTQVSTTTKLHLDGVISILYRMALFRDMPWVAKGPFWFYTDEVNQAVYDVEALEKDVDVSGRTGGNSPYIIDDAAFFTQLENKHLSIYDDGSKGSVRFIHLAGLHTPYTLDENAVAHDDYETSRREQTMGTLHIVNEYLRYLKELGVYDDTYIIITADHGIWNYEDTIEQSEWNGDMAGGPIMLVKPAHQTAEQASEPLQTSYVRTGHIDYPATVIDAVGGNTAKYGPTVFQTDDPERIRYYYWLVHDGSTDLAIYEYAIDGEVTDWDAWSRTGNYWIPKKSPYKPNE